MFGIERMPLTPVTIHFKLRQVQDKAVGSMVERDVTQTKIAFRKISTSQIEARWLTACILWQLPPERKSA